MTFPDTPPVTGHDEPGAPDTEQGVVFGACHTEDHPQQEIPQTKPVTGW